MVVKKKKQVKFGNKNKVSKKVVANKSKRDSSCSCCSCGRSPSNKSKESKVAKLKKLAARNSGKKPAKKKLFGWFKK